MIRLLGPGGVVVLALWVYAVLDVISTDDILVRNLPKGMWVFLVLLFPPIGPIAWLILGRPPYAGLAPGGRTPASRPMAQAVDEAPTRTPPDATSPPTQLTDAHFEAWEEDLARREAALRDGRSRVPSRPADEPPPRWWRASAPHPVSDVHAGEDLVVLRGAERLTALGIDGALRWTSEPLHDDGAGVVRFEGDTIAYWTDRDAVRIDAASGAFLEALDEARPVVEPPARRTERNGWVVSNGLSGLYVKSPDGRRWTTPANVAQEGCAPAELGDWIVWAQADGTVYAIDTAIRTPVTAIQDLGLILR